jgi:hypothetical protein
MLNYARKNPSRNYATLFLARPGACFFAIMMAAFAVTLAATPQQKVVSKTGKSAPKTPAVSVAPFHAGENLVYSGQWLSLNDVIGARLSVNDERPLNSHPAWHFRAQLQTKNPLRYMLPVDDSFDSYAGHTDLAGLQFEMHLNERGKSENHVLRMTPGQTATPAGASQAQVPPGTRDALGFLYYLRTLNWQKTPEIRSPVFDGHKVYDVHVKVVTPRSDLTVAAGKYVATGLSIRPYINGKELADTHITLWLARDAAQTPVLIEVGLPFGSGRVELTPATAAK